MTGNMKTLIIYKYKHFSIQSVKKLFNGYNKAGKI